ncbi:protein of unknown function [Cupriavidus taiwanensis]|uniref:Uncharacterized protein n=1 Tax=Cupriavidus taiwanensis TaxID=164546 RepID=A0A375I8Z6_9BURK|nr:protein of unknown function [Cupriavidus taiwanensis]
MRTPVHGSVCCRARSSMLASSGSDFISQYWRARWFWLGLTALLRKGRPARKTQASLRAGMQAKKKAMVQKTTAFLGGPRLGRWVGILNPSEVQSGCGSRISGTSSTQGVQARPGL